MERLPRVLSTADLPLAELHAARLDGDVVRVGELFCAIDEPDGIVVRATSLAVAWPHRFIAERRTAAWVWGALTTAPLELDLCASLDARTRPQPDGRVNMREVAIDASEVAQVGSLAVTTPLRTVTDLARFRSADAHMAMRAMAHLCATFDISRDQCDRAITSRRNLPNVTLARRRISQCFAIDVTATIEI